MHQRYARAGLIPRPVALVVGPVEDVGVLPLRAEVVDAQAVVVVPRDEGEVGAAHEVVAGARPPGVVEVVVGRRRVIVVPAAEQQVGGGPPQEGLRVHDGVDRRAERVGVEPPVPAGKPDPVDRLDERRQVVVGAGGGVVLVGLEPVGAVIVAGLEVLPPTVVAAGTRPVLQGRAAHVPAVRLVEVAVVVAVGVALAATVAVAVGVGDGLAQGGISYVFETFDGGTSVATLQKSWVKNPAVLFPCTPATHISESPGIKAGLSTP